MKIGNFSRSLQDKILKYRAEHVKPPKNYSLMEWIHTCFQILGAGVGSNICAAQVVNIEQQSNLFLSNVNPMSNPWYFYWTFGFLASVLICFFGLWDIYKWAIDKTNILQGRDVNDI